MTIKNSPNSKAVVTLRDDIDAIKEDVGTLAQHALETGTKSAALLRDEASVRLDELKSAGSKNLARMEKRIREKPGQSLAIAFAAGAFISMLFGRR